MTPLSSFNMNILVIKSQEKNWARLSFRKSFLFKLKPDFFAPERPDNILDLEWKI